MRGRIVKEEKAEERLQQRPRIEREARVVNSNGPQRQWAGGGGESSKNLNRRNPNVLTQELGHCSYNSDVPELT